MLYSLVGFILPLTCRLKDKWLFILACVLLIQPLPLFYVIHACVDPSFVTPSIPTGSYWGAAFQVQSHGTFLETLRVNLWEGQWRRPGSKFHLPFFVILPLLLLIPSFASAQQPEAVSLEQAIEIAKQNHPRLKIAANAIRQAKATRGEIVEAAPTSFSYSWGQLNGENKQDKELAFEQSLGSLLTPFYKNALVSRQVKTSTYYRRMVEKEVIAESSLWMVIRSSLQYVARGYRGLFLWLVQF